MPPARILHPGAEPCPDDASLAFPLMVKPATRGPDLWAAVAGRAKALRVDTPAELRTLWPQLATSPGAVLLQQLVPGPETLVESYHVYVDERAEVVAGFTGRKIRTFPTAFGDSSALEITDAPDVAALGRDVVRRLELRGVAKLDFRRSPEGRLYLLEVNPRFTLWHHLGAAAGLNIPALVHGDLLGRPRPLVWKARAGVRWCKVWTDWRAARASEIPMLRWLWWAARCEAKSALGIDDPLPLVRAALWRLLVGRQRAPRDRPTRLVLESTPVSTGEGASCPPNNPIA